MRLLKPQQIKSGQELRAQEIAREVQAASSAHAKTLAELHQARVLAEAEKSKITAELYAVEQDVELKKAGLLGEIRELEDRKKKALEPIEERVRHAEELEKRTAEGHKALDRMAYRVGEEKSELAALKASLIDRESHVKEQEERIAHRLDRLDAAEELNRKSTNDLANTWQTFKQEVEKSRKDIADKEANLLTEKEVVQREKARLLQEAERLADVEKALNSKRTTLLLAFEEARKKGIL